MPLCRSVWLLPLIHTISQAYLSAAKLNGRLPPLALAEPEETEPRQWEPVPCRLRRCWQFRRVTARAAADGAEWAQCGCSSMVEL